MRTDIKLASTRGVFQKMNLLDILQSARRIIEAKAERATVRPLRDIDGWSDQAEVAYYEEMCAKRA